MGEEVHNKTRCERKLNPNLFTYKDVHAYGLRCVGIGLQSKLGEYWKKLRQNQLTLV